MTSRKKRPPTPEMLAVLQLIHEGTPLDLGGDGRYRLGGEEVPRRLVNRMVDLGLLERRLGVVSPSEEGRRLGGEESRRAADFAAWLKEIRTGKPVDG